jgi:hypothetical protein
MVNVLEQETFDLLHTFTREKFKLRLDKRFMSHHLVFQDGMELLELTQGDNKGLLAPYVQDFFLLYFFLQLGDKGS